MANNKNQHFVPKCHLRPFSNSKDGADINLYNIKRDSFIFGAPIKGQCSRHYHYGNDHDLEVILQRFEGQYATVLRAIDNGDLLSKSNLSFLMRFMHLQYHRTVMAVQRMDASTDTLRNEIYRDTSEKPDDDRPDEKLRTFWSLKLCFTSMHFIEDLKICMIINDTSSDLVTSDDPVIFTNKFSFQKLNNPSFGLVNSGFIYIMPLSPKAAVMAYDGGVYTVEGKVGYKVVLKNRSDIDALNELQYLKSHENIYFKEWSKRQEIKSNFNLMKNRRPSTWAQSRTMIRDNKFVNAEIYRFGTDEERVKSRQNLISISFCYPRPSRWLSVIRYRNPPRAYNTGTAMGFVRFKDRSVLQEKLDRYDR